MNSFKSLIWSGSQSCLCCKTNSLIFVLKSSIEKVPAGILEYIKFLFSTPVGLPALQVIRGAFDSKMIFFV